MTKINITVCNRDNNKYLPQICDTNNYTKYPYNILGKLLNQMRVKCEIGGYIYKMIKGINNNNDINNSRNLHDLIPWPINTD